MWDELSFIKLKLGRVGMGRVLHLGPSWHGPIFMWAELAWAELVLGRVVLHPPKVPVMTLVYSGRLFNINKVNKRKYSHNWIIDEQLY